MIAQYTAGCSFREGWLSSAIECRPFWWMRRFRVFTHLRFCQKDIFWPCPKQGIPRLLQFCTCWMLWDTTICYICLVVSCKLSLCFRRHSPSAWPTWRKGHFSSSKCFTYFCWLNAPPFSDSHQILAVVLQDRTVFSPKRCIHHSTSNPHLQEEYHLQKMSLVCWWRYRCSGGRCARGHEVRTWDRATI